LRDARLGVGAPPTIRSYGSVADNRVPGMLVRARAAAPTFNHEIVTAVIGRGWGFLDVIPSMRLC